ncbi:MAG: MATE family efflux transporter [Pseudomonadota bacterium]
MATTTDSAAPPAAATVPVRRHVSDLLLLAWPVMLSRAGILVMAFADTAMLGRYLPGAVGTMNLGLAVFVPVLVVSIGLASGMVPVVAQAFGGGRWEECGRAWRRAVSWATFVSLIAMAIVWRAEWVLGLSWFDLTPEQARAGGDVAVILAPGLIAQVMFAVCAFYLEATRRPFIGLYAMILANILNAALNWVMIYGNLGWPEMGPDGAALASTLARVGAAGFMFAVIFGQRDALAAGVRGPWETVWGPGGWRAGYQMRKLGFSAGMANGFETVGFAAMMLFAGSLGAAALDAYSISHNMVSTVFMVGLGLAIATGVRVGQELGAGRPRDAVVAGWTGFFMCFAVMGIMSVLVITFREDVVRAYTDDPEIAARAATVFLVAALIFVPDALQVVMGQSVRALGDAWVPIAAYVLSFVVVLVPLGQVMIGPVGMDERGLAWAIIISCALATVLLAWRFHWLTRPPGPKVPG